MAGGSTIGSSGGARTCLRRRDSMAIIEQAATGINRIEELLGADAESLLSFTCKGITKDQIMLPGPDHLDRAWGLSDRKPGVLVNLQRLVNTGRLAGTGY